MRNVTLLDFWADWCSPCRQMLPIVDELAVNYNVYKLNIEDDLEAVDKYKITSIPTFIITVNGEEVERILGSTSKATLEAALVRHGA